MLTARRAILVALTVIVAATGSILMPAAAVSAGGIGGCAGTWTYVNGKITCIVSDPGGGGGGGGVPVGGGATVPRAPRRGLPRGADDLSG